MLAHDEATSPADVLAEIVREGQLRPEFAADLDARLMGECLVGAINRVAIHRRFATLPRRLAEYERELTDAVLVSLVPRRRRTPPA